MAELNFDLSTVEASQGFELMPFADYNLAIIGSEVKPTQANPSFAYLQLTIEVLDGHFKNRKLWYTLNLWNSETASAIAKQDLKAILLAAGLPITTTDSTALHGRPMTCKVGVKKGTNGYEDKNVVKSWGVYAGPAGQAPGPFAGAPVGAPVIPTQPNPFAQVAAPVAPVAPAAVQVPAAPVNPFAQAPVAVVPPAPVAAAPVAPANPLAGAALPPWGAPAAPAQG